MEKLLGILTVCILSPSLPAQTLTLGDLLERGEMGYESGFHPKSLYSLVASSTLIVRGKQTRVVSARENWLGYNEKGEDITWEEYSQRRDIRRGREHHGAPMSEIEILVEEVFLGDRSLEGQTIIQRLGGLADEESADPGKERIWFMVQEPNGDYAVLGMNSVFTLSEGRYVNYLPETHVRSATPVDFENSQLQFETDFSVEAFEEEIKEIVRLL